MIRFFTPASTMWAVLLLILWVGSCTPMRQPSLRFEHYTLEYAPPEKAGLPALPVSLRIDRFSVAQAYATQQMIYRDASFKREAYTYHRWRSHPGDLVSDYLARDMRHSGLFRAVVQEASTIPPTHILEGSVDEFFEWNDEDGWKAVLSVTSALVNARETDLSKKIVFQRTFRAVVPCKGKSPAALAQAMSEAMAAVSEEILRTVYERLSANNDQ